jgi:SAM-dependent methyltransferase
MLNYAIIRTQDTPCPVCRRWIHNLDEKITVKDYLNLHSTQDFFYLKCSCGVFFLRNQPLVQEVKKIYSKDYQAYKISTGMVSRLKKIRMQKVVRPMLSEGRNTKILDYGCGSGEFVYSISELVDSNVVGYDISIGDSLSSSNTFFTDLEPQIESHGPYDLIFSFQVIEHLPNPKDFLCFLNSNLSKNGKVVLETPSSSGILFHKSIRNFWGGWHAPRHFTIFDKTSIMSVCQASGFEIKSFRYIPSPFQWIETFRPFLRKESRANKFLSLNNFPLVAIFYTIDVFLIKLGFKSSNMQIVLKKYTT